MTETAGFESAWLELRGKTLRAGGRAVGQLPSPYWLSYSLETDERAVTARLEVVATMADVEHRLDLRREGSSWSVDGMPRPDLADALDCDLGYSPLTNTMPIIRHGFHLGPGSRQFTMAWVQVPNLEVVAVRQKYEHLSLVPGGARIRYSSGTFSSDLLIDGDGIVVEYPQLGHLIDPEGDDRDAPGGRAASR